LLFLTRVASTTAFQMVSVIVGWHVYEITNSALHSRLIGLRPVSSAVPSHAARRQIADRLNRRVVLWWCYGSGVPVGGRPDVGCLCRIPALPDAYGAGHAQHGRALPSSSR
jgi:hypothetical protein